VVHDLETSAAGVERSKGFRRDRPYSALAKIERDEREKVRPFLFVVGAVERQRRLRLLSFTKPQWGNKVPADQNGSRAVRDQILTLII
jgi:hypothetical protein